MKRRVLIAVVADIEVEDEAHLTEVARFMRAAAPHQLKEAVELMACDATPIENMQFCVAFDPFPSFAQEEPRT